MNKYNTGRSMVTENLSDEIEKAIKEWSEGSESLERLLRTCHLIDDEHKIDTKGCCKHAAYIQFVPKNPYACEKIKQMLNVAQNIEGSQVLISPDGGYNILGGNAWDVPDIAFGFTGTQREKEECFDQLNEVILLSTIQEKPQYEIYCHMLDFYNFFVGKESCLSFRIKNLNGQYEFSIESRLCTRNFEYYNTLFKSFGLKLEDNPEKHPRDLWKIADSDPSKMSEKLRRIKEGIIKEWTLGLPTDIVDGMSDVSIVHIKKREFGNTIEGKTQFKEWLNEFRRIEIARGNGIISMDGYEKWKKSHFRVGKKESTKEKDGLKDVLDSGIRIDEVIDMPKHDEEIPENGGNGYGYEHKVL